MGAPRAGLGGLARALGAGPGGRAGGGRAAGLVEGVGAAAAVLVIVALPRPLVRLAARHFRRKCIFEMPPRKGGERKCAPAPLSPAPCARPRAPLLPHPLPVRLCHGPAWHGLPAQLLGMQAPSVRGGELTFVCPALPRGATQGYRPHD